MSPSVYITRRQAASGPRYVVRYRLGGRAFRLVHAGSFKTMKEARARRDFVAGELAAGRDPQLTLRELARQPHRRTFSEWAAAFLASRVDVDDTTRESYERRARALEPLIGDRDPGELTAADAQELVAALAGRLRPASVKAYVGFARQVLDYAKVQPNPLRDADVRLPRDHAEEPAPPSAREVVAILERIPARHVLPLVVLEQTAMRVGELEGLTWGDVDVAESRFRLPRARTKTNRARWVQVPRALMDAVEELCPLEDRTAGRKVFPAATDAALRQAMGRACRDAGIAVYSPHDLRHRRTSLWHGQGIPTKELSERIGHARASLTLDRYSHVMPLDEVPQATWERLLVRSR